MRLFFIRAMALSLALIPVAKATESLEIYADVYPPFVDYRSGRLSGPFIDAFDALLKEHGISAHYSTMPSKRIMQLLPQKPNSCALAVHFSPGDAETVSFVAPVSPITLSVYGLREKPMTIHNIEDLRRYSVGVIDIAEARDLLDASNIPYVPVPFAAHAREMLEARRFDLLISDSELELESGSSNITRIFTLARLERWLACQNSLPPKTLRALRQALQDGVYAESVRPIWKRYELASHFDQVRHEWESRQKNNDNGGQRP